MEPLDSDSSSFTWSALNSDSGIFGGSSNGKAAGGSSGSGSGSNDDAPVQNVPTRPSASAKAQVNNRPHGFITSVTTKTFALPSAVVPSSSRQTPSIATTVASSSAKAVPATSGLPSSVMASISSVMASAAAASSLSASLAATASPSGPLNNITSDATAGDSSDPVPLRRNPPMLLLLVLGCLVGAATIIASLAWLCRVSDSRKRAKKKARLNQSSWDPDASSSVFDGASSSGVGGGASSLLGGAESLHMGDPLQPAERNGDSATQSWWMLGEGGKQTSSPSLMEYEYDGKDEKYDDEREEGSAIFIDNVGSCVSVPQAVVLDPSHNHRTPSMRHQRRPGSILSGLGMGTRPLPLLSRGFGSRNQRGLPVSGPQAQTQERLVSAQTQYTIPPFTFQDSQDVAGTEREQDAPSLPPKRSSLDNGGMMSSRNEASPTKRLSDIATRPHANSNRYSAPISRRSTHFGPNPHLELTAATPSLVGGEDGSGGGPFATSTPDRYTALPARGGVRHSFGHAPPSSAKQGPPPAPVPTPISQGIHSPSTSRQSSWEHDMRLHGSSPLRRPPSPPDSGSIVSSLSPSPSPSAGGADVLALASSYVRSATPVALQSGRFGLGGGAVEGPSGQSLGVGRVGTPVLSPLLNQLRGSGSPAPGHGAAVGGAEMGGGAGVEVMVRPGTPSSLMPGRVGTPSGLGGAPIRRPPPPLA